MTIKRRGTLFLALGFEPLARETLYFSENKGLGGLRASDGGGEAGEGCQGGNASVD